MFQECWDILKFASRGAQYGTIEFIYKSDDDARLYAIRTIETDWLLFSRYLGRVVRIVRIGAIPTTIKPQWALAAALKAEEKYEIHNIKKMETLFFGGVGSTGHSVDG